MNVKSLLDKAAACTTDEQAQEAAQALAEAFGKTRALSGLSALNIEGYIEAPGRPHLSMELVRQLSEHYALCIVPEIRDETLTVVARLDHFKDGQGMQSCDFERVFDEDSDILEAQEEQTVKELAKLAKEMAIKLHARLIESVGVSERAAQLAAKRAWSDLVLARPY